MRVVEAFVRWPLLFFFSLLEARFADYDKQARNSNCVAETLQLPNPALSRWRFRNEREYDTPGVQFIGFAALGLHDLGNSTHKHGNFEKLDRQALIGWYSRLYVCLPACREYSQHPTQYSKLWTPLGFGNRLGGYRDRH